MKAQKLTPKKARALFGLEVVLWHVTAKRYLHMVIDAVSTHSLYCTYRGESYPHLGTGEAWHEGVFSTRDFEVHSGK